MDEKEYEEFQPQPGGGSGSSEVDPLAMPPSQGAPSCQVCGRRDETVRAVIIPYVISLLVITFRRAWTGVFCWRHRILRLLAAGGITSLLGWWGVPWGLIYTSGALFKLARGGEIPEDANVKLLARIALHKLNTGEPGEAIRVFQEGLRIKEDERTRNSLIELQSKYPLSHEMKDRRAPFWLGAGLIAASVFGIGIGVLDYLVTFLFSWILGGETYLLLEILTWAPFVAFLFLGAITLNELLRWVMEQTATDHLLLGVLFSLGAGGLLWYGVPQGFLIGEYLAALIGGLQVDSIVDLVMTTGAVFSQGGIWFVLDALESGLIGDYIYLVLWLLAGIGYLWLALRGAQESVHWRVRLELLSGDLRMEEPRSQAASFGVLGGFALALLIGMAVFAGQGRLLRGGPDLAVHIERGDAHYDAGEYDQAEEAYRQAISIAPNQAGPHESLAWTLYASGATQAAAQEFVLAMELDPEWADPHIGMGYIHLGEGAMAEAAQAFQAVLDLTTEPYYVGQAYYGLGNIAHHEGELQDAIAFYEQAVREDWQLAIAHMDMALAYYAMADFDRTIEHARDLLGISPDWAAPHGLLALAYFQTNQSEAMDRALDWAVDLDPTDLYSLLLMADVYWSLEQYELAGQVMSRARAFYPENAQAPLLLARIAALRGDFSGAHALVDEQLDHDPGLVDAYLSRAWVYIEQQDLDKAKLALVQAISLDPQGWEAHNLLSFVAFHQGRNQEAFEEASLAIELFPYDGSCYVHRAFAARGLGDSGQALADAQRALTLEPQYDLGHFILGVVYVDRGDTELAVASLEKFLDLARDRAYVRDYIQQAQAVLDQLRIDESG